eukprot:5443142-Prymnesium_polylepis.1
MSTLCHASDSVRKQAAIGLGQEALHVAAVECERAAKWMQAGQIMFAASNPLGAAGGEQLKRAAAALCRVVPPTDESKALEMRVLNGLFIATDGYAWGSDEHTALLKRMAELGAQDGNQAVRSTAAMDAALARSLPLIMEARALSGMTGYKQMTMELVRQAYLKLLEYKEAANIAALATPDELQEGALMHRGLFDLAGMPMSHSLDEFDWDAVFGQGGCLLRQNITRYDAKQHQVAKTLASQADVYMYGGAEAGLLLHWCDLESARLGW